MNWKDKSEKHHTKCKPKCCIRFKPVKLYFSNRLNKKKNYIKMSHHHWKYAYRQLLSKNSCQLAAFVIL